MVRHRSVALLDNIVTIDDPAVSFHTPETKQQYKQWTIKGDALTIGPPTENHVILRPTRSSPMDLHRAPPISGSWLPGAARPLTTLRFYTALCELIGTPRLKKK
jgi:hypothetical protein